MASTASRPVASRHLSPGRVGMRAQCPAHPHLPSHQQLAAHSRNHPPRLCQLPLPSEAENQEGIPAGLPVLQLSALTGSSQRPCAPASDGA